MLIGDTTPARTPLAQRLLHLHDAQRLHLVSPYFLDQQHFRSRYTAPFLRLLFKATLLEKHTGAVLQIALADLAALLGCMPRTAQAAAREAEAAGWCAVLPSFSLSPHIRRSHRLADGYALTSQFRLCEQKRGVAS